MGRALGQKTRPPFNASSKKMMGERLEYYWEPVEVDEAIKLYEAGASLDEMVKELGKEAIEILLMLDEMLYLGETVVIRKLSLGEIAYE